MMYASRNTSPERYYKTEYSHNAQQGYGGGSEYVTTSHPLESELEFSHFHDDASSVHSSYSRPASDFQRNPNPYRRDAYTESLSGNYSRSSARYPASTHSHYPRQSRTPSSLYGGESVKKSSMAQLFEKVEQERYGPQVLESQVNSIWGEPFEQENCEKKSYKTQINEEGMLVMNDIKRIDSRARPKRRVKSKPYRTTLDAHGNLSLAPKSKHMQNMRRRSQQAEQAHRVRDHYTFRNQNSEYETTVLDPHGRPIPNPMEHTVSMNYTKALLRRQEIEQRKALHLLHLHAARSAPAPHPPQRTNIMESSNPMAGYVGVNPDPYPNTVHTGVFHESNTADPAMMKQFEKAVITSKGTNENWRLQLGRHGERVHKQDPTKKIVYSSGSLTSLSSENISDKSSTHSKESVTSSGAVDVTRLGNGVLIVRGALSEAKQHWLLRQAKNQLSSESKGPLYEPLTTFEEGIGMAGMMKQILEKVRAQYPDDFPECSPTHVRFTENQSLMGSHWHADEDGEESNKKPLMSVCIGNSYTFGYRPIWINVDTNTLEKMGLLAYKSQSYMSPPDFIDIHSGDVIIWGGVNRFLVHNVERVYPRSSSVATNSRYEIVFRDYALDTAKTIAVERALVESNGI